MKNKGFTLIELLAVIVILAIIALIATPIILGIINNAREQAKVRTAELIAKEVELAYTSYLFKNNGEGSADSFCDYMTEEFFAMDNGDIGTCTNGVVTVESGSDTYTVTYVDGTAKVTYEDSEEELSKVKLKGNSSSGSENFVYMWYEGENVDGPSLNEVINPSNYAQTLPSGQNYYLKFKLDSTNKVIEGYACAIYNGTTYCVQGGNPSYYGSYTGMSGTTLYDVSNLNPTGNIAILNSIKTANPSYDCYFTSDTSYCSGASVYLSVDWSGNSNTGAASGDYDCNVNNDGSSYCGSSL